MFVVNVGKMIKDRFTCVDKNYAGLFIYCHLQNKIHSLHKLYQSMTYVLFVDTQRKQ